LERLKKEGGAGLDTNIVAYAFGSSVGVKDGANKQILVKLLLAHKLKLYIARHTMVELVHVFFKNRFLLDGEREAITSDRKQRRRATEKAARKFLALCASRLVTLEPNHKKTLELATLLHVEHQLSIYDGFVVGSCFGTTKVLSEDMNDGERRLKDPREFGSLGTLTILDPFINSGIKR
jgi:predicted nucleic acid-binding protein